VNRPTASRTRRQSQPNGQGGTVKPFHFTSLTDNGGDPNHDWDAIHSEWDNGKMDGFYTTNGKTAMGYYKSPDLPYYYSLFPQFTRVGERADPL
jgi:phospholipase C